MFSESGLSIDELFTGERNFIANAGNFCSFIYHNFENLNWVGFYFMNRGELVLGPFQGKTACVRIAVGKGVCGTSVAKKETIIVDDVHEFPGHIACDAASRSEIVIPVIYKDVLIGVLDIDSPVLKRFTSKEEETFNAYLDLLIHSSNMDEIINYYIND